MKKSIYRILSIIVIMAIAVSTMAFAEENLQGTTDAVYTIGTIEGAAGETVSVPVSFKTTSEAGIAALFIEFDTSKLEFTGFTWDAAIQSSLDMNMTNANTDENTILTAFKAQQLFDGTLGTIEFKIKDSAPAGDVEITALGITNDDNMAAIGSSVVAGKVAVTGQIADAPATSEENENTDPEDGEPTKELTSQERAEDVICLKIDNPTAFAYGNYGLIDSSNDKVVPYIKNDRTLVPLRFVSETLGAQVEWEDGWNYCYVNKGDKKIKITFGSADIEVNGEVITYDAPVEVVEDRTMVPIRFISEELGYHIYWNQPNQVVIITPADNPWNEKGNAENDLLLDMLVTFLLNGMI